jgi:hypothetical protein
LDVTRKDSLVLNAGAPLFVHRLDVPAHDYYLVPWEDDRGIVWVVQVDAVNGGFASAAPFPSPQPRLVTSADDVRRAVAEKIGPVIDEPCLVWMPCRESTSPLQPLYIVKTQAGAVFFSWSGIHLALTPLGRGG